MLAEGRWTVWRCVQLVPSNSHVSPRFLGAPLPPYRTVTLRSESYAIACHRRGDGRTAGFDACQVLPDSVQVSPNSETSSCPPNSRNCWPPLSNTIELP